VTLVWADGGYAGRTSNARRTGRYYERFEETHEAMVRWAAIRLMIRLAGAHTT